MKCLEVQLEPNLNWSVLLFLLSIFPSHCLCLCCFLCQNALPFLSSYPFLSNSHLTFKVQLKCQFFHGAVPGSLFCFLLLISLPWWTDSPCMSSLLLVKQSSYLLTYQSPLLLNSAFPWKLRLYLVLLIPCRIQNSGSLSRNLECLVGLTWTWASMGVTGVLGSWREGTAGTNAVEPLMCIFSTPRRGTTHLIALLLARAVKKPLWEAWSICPSLCHLRSINVFFHIFMHSLIDSCMSPDWVLNPYPWHIGMTPG